MYEHFKEALLFKKE